MATPSPRFSEKDIRVLITFEGKRTDDVAGAQALLVERVGAKVVRQDAPQRAG